MQKNKSEIFANKMVNILLLLGTAAAECFCCRCWLYTENPATMAGFSVYKQISWDKVPTDFIFTQYVYESWDFVPTFNERRRIKCDIVTLDFISAQYA